MSDMSETKPWRDEDRLRELYTERKLSALAISNKFGVHETTIGEWLDRFGVEKRGVSEARELAERRNPAPYRTEKNGYECWHVRSGEDSDKLYVHRLLAVAEFGAEAVGGSHIHHKNGIPWDNRPENIEPVSPSEHMSKHRKGTASYYKIDKFDCGDIRERIDNGEHQETLAREYNVSQSTIGRHFRGECLHD